MISYYPCPNFEIAGQAIQKFKSKEDSLRLFTSYFNKVLTG